MFRQSGVIFHSTDITGKVNDYSTKLINSADTSFLSEGNDVDVQATVSQLEALHVSYKIGGDVYW